MALRGPTQATASAGPQRVEDQLGRYRVTFGCILPVSGEVKGGSRLHKRFGGIETNGRLTITADSHGPHYERAAQVERTR